MKKEAAIPTKEMEVIYEWFIRNGFYLRVGGYFVDLLEEPVKINGKMYLRLKKIKKAK